jgi:hypothetical protein
LCDTVEEAVISVTRVPSLDRVTCRTHVEEHFSTERMIDRYLSAYAEALERKMPGAPSASQIGWRKHDWWDRPMAFTDVPERPTFSLENTGAE